MADRPVLRNCWAAICPTCQHQHRMPLECLRDEWQSMDCDACAATFQYRGLRTPTMDDPEDFEICTRLPPPIRIQLSRAKGWRMPANTVKVDRTTKWGNPFKVGHNICMGTGLSFRQVKVDTSAASVVAFREMLGIEQRNYPIADVIRTELRGKNLACWCPPDQPCHADVLLELANGDQARP